MDKGLTYSVDPNEVLRKKSRAGFKHLSKEEHILIKHLYQKGSSINEVAKIIGKQGTCIRTSLIKQGVPRRSIRHYQLDESFFDCIDSHEKAQILGLIAADGCVYMTGRNNRAQYLAISLHKKDQEYLEEIRKRLGYTGPLYDKGEIINQFSLSICSKKLTSGLIRCGIHPRKSLTLKFPALDVLPDEFISSYLLGYFEGDGCITSSLIKHYTRPQYNTMTCTTKEFGQSMVDILANWGISSHLRKHGNIYRVDVSGNKNIKKFLTILYKNAAFKMRRKYDRFLNLLSLYEQPSIDK